jgi:hypothetical protein
LGASNIKKLINTKQMDKPKLAMILKYLRLKPTGMSSITNMILNFSHSYHFISKVNVEKI